MQQIIKELIESIDNENESLYNDYDYLNDNVRKLFGSVTREQKINMEWLLAKLHTDMVILHTSLKELQKAVRDAGQKIQN